jgi:hypothetical protein
LQHEEYEEREPEYYPKPEEPQYYPKPEEPEYYPKPHEVWGRGNKLSANRGTWLKPVPGA